MNIIINNRLEDIKEVLRDHQTLSVMGMPGGGISVLLKELTTSDLGHPIYIDVFGLPSLTPDELFYKVANELGISNPIGDSSEVIKSCIQRISELTSQKGRVVLYFAGFDQLAGVIDGKLLQGLQAIVRSNTQVRLVFGLCVSIKKLIPDTYFDSGLRLFGNKYYIGGYSRPELEYWLSQYGPESWQERKDVDKEIQLSGGHLQLLLTLLNESSELTDRRNESADLLFKNLYALLPGPQRTIIRSSALGKKVPNDEYLRGIGIIDKQGQLFSPLFTNWVAATQRTQLPVKERRLYMLLKKNIGKVVSKDEIMEVVWKGEIVSEWTLNALIYRLRKHSSFQSKGLLIENHKKLGYQMIKEI